MGFWDVVSTGLGIVNELLKDSTQSVVNWVNNAAENGAAGVLLKRRKDARAWRVTAQAVDQSGRPLATENWTIERNSSFKVFMGGEENGASGYEKGLRSLFNDQNEIFYDFTAEGDAGEDDEDYDDEDDD